MANVTNTCNLQGRRCGRRRSAGFCASTCPGGRCRSGCTARTRTPGENLRVSASNPCSPCSAHRDWCQHVGIACCGICLARKVIKGSGARAVCWPAACRLCWASTNANAPVSILAIQLQLSSGVSVLMQGGAGDVGPEARAGRQGGDGAWGSGCGLVQGLVGGSGFV